MELKKRTDMNPDYQWDLTPIFEDAEAWRAALADAEAAVKGLESLPGTLCASVEGLKAGLESIYAAAEKVERVYSYAFLCKAGDNGDSACQEMEARAIRLFVDMETAMAFVNPEILTVPQDRLEAWMAEPALKT